MDLGYVALLYVVLATGCHGVFISATYTVEGSGGNTVSGSGGNVVSGSGGNVVSGSGGNPVDAAPAATCGNGRIEPGESCDGTNLNGSTCVSLGFAAGTLSCSSSCQLDAHACSGGTIKPMVVASRTSCAAPCGVFFDATGTTGLSGLDYVGANWTWDFNDPTSPHKGTIGFNVAHVFDNPGTYHVTTGVRDLIGASGSITTDITVSAMSGKTYYVSTSGRDSNTGLTTTAPFLTLAHALSVGGSANNSILLRRGDTFSLSATTNISEAGPFLIGAYTDPASSSTNKPALNVSLTMQYAAVFNLASASDIRFTDLFVNYTNPTNSCPVFQLTSSPNALWERVEATFNTNGGTVWNSDTSSNNFIAADCNLHDFNGYGYYGQSPQGVAIIGTTMSNFTTSNHSIRVQGGTNGVGAYATNTYIAENTFTPNSSVPGGFGDVTERGDNTKSVIVNNYFKATSASDLTLEPQNTSSVEHITNGLVEGNTIIGTQQPFKITAQHIYVRNNLFEGPDYGVYVVGDPQMPANWTDQIFVYNNTQFTNNGTMNNDTYFLGHETTSGSVTVANNVLWTSHSSKSSQIVSADGKGTEVINNNLIYAPNAGASLSSPNVGTGGISQRDPLFVSTDVTNPSAFQLSTGSPAIDTGMMVPVYRDLTGNVTRPQGSGWDIGAFEFPQVGADAGVAQNPSPAATPAVVSSPQLKGKVLPGRTIPR